jgi:hypothetical protein
MEGRDMAILAAANGKLGILEWLRKSIPSWAREDAWTWKLALLEAAAGAGQIDVIYWYFQNGFSNHCEASTLILEAARGGHVTVLKFAASVCERRVTPFDQLWSRAICEASCAGHTHVVTWLARQGIPRPGEEELNRFRKDREETKAVLTGLRRALGEACK